MRKSLGRRMRHKQSPSKLIIRHLPPNLTEDVFKETLDLPTDANSHWYLAGPVSADLGCFATARAYVTFTRMDELILFKDKYDGYVFIDSKGGGEYRAQVDLAPFQKVPKSRKTARKDGKTGTLEKDADYLKFVESLSAPKSESNVNATELNLKELENRDRELKLSNGCPKITTPLIEFVLKKKSDRSRKKTDESRSQEERHRRNNGRRQQTKNERVKGNKKQAANVQNDNSEKKTPRESGVNKTKSSGGGSGGGGGGGQSKARDSKDRPKFSKKPSEQVNETNVVLLTKKSPAATVAKAVTSENTVKKGEDKTREPRKRRWTSKDKKGKKVDPKGKDEPSKLEKKSPHSS